jgi:hypothetical protein
MQKLSDNKIKIIHRNAQSTSMPAAPKKGITFFNLFYFPKAQIPVKSTATALKEPIMKTSSPNISRTDLTAVRNWVALEEKIVHGYKEQKTAQPKGIVPLSQTPAKQSPPAFETFSTQTAVSSSSTVPKLKNPPRDSERTFLVLERFLLVLGWLAAGAFVFLFVQETFLSHETLQKLSQLQDDKKQLEQSYSSLKYVSEDQVVEIEWLNDKLQGTTSELRVAKSELGAAKSELGAAKSELRAAKSELRAAKSEIDVLQNTARTQNAIVNALKAQSQAFEKIIGQGSTSAFSGAVAGLSQEQFLAGRNSVLQGEVISVNERQGFMVISVGADQGARSGSWITISRDGRGLAVGRIERAYPTMSVAVPRSSGMLRTIQEGDSVSFS